MENNVINNVINLGPLRVSAPEPGDVPVRGHRWELDADLWASGKVFSTWQDLRDTFVGEATHGLRPVKHLVEDVSGGFRKGAPIALGQIHEEFLNTGSPGGYEAFADRYGLLFADASWTAHPDALSDWDMYMRTAPESAYVEHSYRRLNEWEVWENVYWRVVLLNKFLTRQDWGDLEWVKGLKVFVSFDGRWAHRELFASVAGTEFGFDRNWAPCCTAWPPARSGSECSAFVNGCVSETFQALMNRGCRFQVRKKDLELHAVPRNLAAALVMSVFVDALVKGGLRHCSVCNRLFHPTNARQTYCRGYCKTVQYRARKKAAKTGGSAG